MAFSIGNRKRPCALAVDVPGREEKVWYSTCPICLFQVAKDELQAHVDECAGDLDAPYSSCSDFALDEPSSTGLTPSASLLGIDSLSSEPNEDAYDQNASSPERFHTPTGCDEEHCEFLSPGNEGGSQFIPSPVGSPIRDAVDDKTSRPIPMTANHFPVFPIFKAKTKTLYLIRHGESEYNAAASVGPGFEDPLIFDPHLTIKGRGQARNLGPLILNLQLPENTLYVTSPLTRAMETLLIGLKSAGLPLQEQLAGNKGADQSEASCLPGVSVQVVGQLTEHLATSGDIGRPRTQLVQEFPELRSQLMAMQEGWWWDPLNNSAVDKRFAMEESKEHLRRRTGNFRAWLLSREESHIVVVGHSTFFRYFIREQCGKHCQKTLRNGEMIRLVL